MKSNKQNWVKQAIELWLRAIVADEVGRFGVDLQREKVALNAVAQRLHEVSQCGDEVMRLRETVQTMNAGVAGINDCVKQLHPR